MESAVLLSCDEYRLLVEHSPVMIWRSGTDALCNYFNQTWLSFTGRTLAQEIGNGWAEGVHADDYQRCVAFYLSSFERRQPFEMEYRLRRHDGVYRWIFDRGVPFRDDTGAFAGYIGSCVDVDERRRADHAKATFLSMMAHELRTPLTSMRVYVDALLRKTFAQKSVTDAVAKLGKQLARFSSLIDDLNDTARLEQGAPLAIHPVDIDLGDVVRQALQQQPQSLVGAGAPSRHTLSLSGAEGAFPTRGDPGRLHQVLVNLLDNAIKYTPAGGEIALRLATVGAEQRLSISDPGIGIPPEEMAQLTRRYFRASNAAPVHYPGLGLGLAIAREIVEQHGGHLAIESTLGRGTTVIVSLPSAASAGAAS